MATPKTIRAGQAYVELATRNNRFNKGLEAASKRLKAWGQSVTAVGLRLMAVAGAAAVPFAFAIKRASDMEEVMNKFNVVFGQSADVVKSWGDEFAEQVGRSKKQVTEYLANTQDLLVPIGFDDRDATVMSKQITQLAIDLASFNNMADDDVITNLHAALTGAGAVMKKYGVIVSDATMKQELLNQGLDPNNATEMQKVQARMNLILAGTAAAQGDAIRSAGSYANQMKALSAAVDDTATTIGNVLLPIVTPLVTKLVGLTRIVGQFIENNQPLVAWAFKIAAAVLAAGAAIVAFGLSLTVIGVALGGIVSLFGLIGTALSAVLGLVGFLISPLGLVIALVAGLAGYFLHASGVAGEVIDFLGSLFGDLAGIAKTSFGAIGKALAAGDIALAAKVLWTSLKLAWQTGINALWGPWTAFRNTLLDTWTDLKTTLADISLSIWDGIQKAFSHGVETVLKIVYGLLRGYYTIQEMLGKDVSVEMMTLFSAEMATGVMGKKERQDIDKATAGARDQLTQMGEEEKRRRERDTQRELTGAAEELAKAAAEWQDAVGQADALPTLGQREGPRGTAASAPEFPSFDAVAGQARRATSAGSFNAQAASFLGGSSAADRTATATEKTAQNTKKLLDQPGPAFG